MGLKENCCIEDIKNVLPHRYPFLLVDRVLELGSEHVVAIKNVSANEPFFAGHFPSKAVMPGVLQIEAMAQVGGLIIAHGDNFDKEKEIAFLAGVNNAKFKKIVTPGDQLTLKAKVIARKKGLFKIETQALVDEQVASSAEIILVVKAS